MSAAKLAENVGACCTSTHASCSRKSPLASPQLLSRYIVLVKTATLMLASRSAIISDEKPSMSPKWNRFPSVLLSWLWYRNQPAAFCGGKSHRGGGEGFEAQGL